MHIKASSVWKVSKNAFVKYVLSNIIHLLSLVLNYWYVSVVFLYKAYSTGINNMIWDHLKCICNQNFTCHGFCFVHEKETSREELCFNLNAVHSMKEPSGLEALTALCGSRVSQLRSQVSWHAQKHILVWIMELLFVIDFVNKLQHAYTACIQHPYWIYCCLWNVLIKFK
jgi:hypothetical protein